MQDDIRRDEKRCGEIRQDERNKNYGKMRNERKLW